MLASQLRLAEIGGGLAFMGFTKLDAGIIDSSLWSEPPATRVVWITMLAKSDRTGHVRTSRDGLFRASNIQKADFDIAMTCLESHDENSRSSGFEGRRIEKVEGGWLILNYLKYRDFSYSDNPESVRKREYRAGKNGTCPNLSQDTLGHSACASDSGIPSLQEIKTEASMRCISMEVAEKFHAHYAGNNLWLNQHGRLIDWRIKLKTWSVNERQTNDGKSRRISEKRIDRSIGTANEGIASQYANFGKVAKLKNP